MRLQHCPHHPHLIFSLAYNPYAAAGPSTYSSNAALTPPYTSSHLPNMPPTLLTILTLEVPSRHASEAPYHPYACGVPSRHASDATYHPYARIVPAQHANNAACSALPTYLRHRLPSLCSQCPPNIPLTPLTILNLAVTSRHASNTAYHPYARIVPS
ncbi:hypothetical protein O181_132265 [Austropuccinia psidii MF-1]|uniref:Uncharacterized protein n=1 Tax=Austropuccinia psidii MF-1 TaxID=1389203 RepID=A0A9Q3QCP8_9BASI|nr:hypothetical protein [Austropuccinia psidii MF-1]